MNYNAMQNSYIESHSTQNSFGAQERHSKNRDMIKSILFTHRDLFLV
jgi:hypothetical protein